MRSFAYLVASGLTVVLLTRVAHADDKPDAVRAASLFAEGRKSMAAEDYAAACPKLAESQALAPAPDTAWDLGICYEKASQAAFRAAHELARLPVEPRIAAATSAPATAPYTDAPAPGESQRAVGLTIGAVGLAGIIGGVVLAVVAKSTYDSARADCSSNVCSSARGVSQWQSAQQLATASSVSLLAGAAAAGAGVTVFFTAPKSKPAIGLAAAAAGTGLSVAGRF